MARGYQGCKAELRSDVVGAWDFHANITTNIASTCIIDTSPSMLNGSIINMPVRAMTGFNWTGDEIIYHHKPEEYGAIHFHDDDIDDARWDVDFELKIPEGLKEWSLCCSFKNWGRGLSRNRGLHSFCDSAT